MFWLFVLLTVLLWGISPILDKYALKLIDPAVGVLIRALTTGILLLGFMGASGKLKALGSVDLKSAALVALSGVCASLLGQWAYFKALQTGKASQVVPLCSTYPLVAALLAVLILRERITLERAAGVLLVIAGIWLIRR